ncbi:2-oxoglutarate ferredoxin oxidoreductase subunit alpha [Bryocella elongata]|uniref:2-oxoglutarate ferredoxin oxidoreductase subunit alpha n=1 Tax=Bryocella elongata TaxID=863522 RepID=A0A1H5SFU2_9BACT|nr:2-oxoacid:acceptor oxidoreductase subunit alpha [Bryocella elongata]SEF49466.1 2-oxoglutarate ferredoxin oxidoreductase subunit alpha [Bryocella elongata]
MATQDVAVAAGHDRPAESGSTANAIPPGKKINDLSIQIATVNGSGSQSANSVLLRSIFGMGIPVSGKNLFPSNIAGLPTWYTIRASKDGYVARKKEIDVVIAMNAETAQEDVKSLRAGAAAIYEESYQLSQLRDDVAFYPVPFDKLIAGVCPEAKLRKLVKNMIYVGVAAWLLEMPLTVVEPALRKQFAKKQKAADLNWGAVQAGFEYAQTNFTKKDPFVLEPMNETAGKIIIDGNAAAGLGCVFAGCTVVMWYPITPSTSLVEAFIDYAKKFRIEADGKATFAIVQAEDELAAIGGVLGAGWAGARAMTATSGPGISLMAEFSGLGYYAELPGVIFDVQRGGPSTGMPTRNQQADLLACSFLSHGDTKHVLLIPGSVKECYEMAIAAFDLAEVLQTPIFVMSDLDLGMNNWMSEPFVYPEKPMDRGRVLTAEQLTELGGFARYKDTDGSGIGSRTLPGTNHPQAAYFTRGTSHNEKTAYSERPDDYINNVERLNRKWETARTLVPRPEVVQTGKAKVGLIAFGSTDFALRESRDQVRNEYGLETDYLRLKAFPFTRETVDFIAAHDRVYVVEQNRDAQMLSLLKLDIPAELIVKLRSIRHFSGIPIDARSITDELVMQEGL